METKLFIERPATRTRVQISELQPGDRFYFCSDKKKIVWQVQELKKKKTWVYGAHTWACDIKVRNDAGQVKYCLRKTEVIYLRSVN